MNLAQVLALSKFDGQHQQFAGTDPEEKLFLYSLVSLYRPKHVIEIGCSAGHSTAWLALACMHCKAKLTSVDNFSKKHGGRAEGPQIPKKRLLDTKLGIEKVVTFVKSDSAEFLSKQPDKSTEIVWVDGAHDYESASKDIKQALRVASHLVVVHDTFQQAYDDVRRACSDLVIPGCFIDAIRGFYLIRTGDFYKVHEVGHP